MYEIYLVFHHLAGGIEKWREKKGISGKWF